MLVCGFDELASTKYWSFYYCLRLSGVGEAFDAAGANRAVRILWGRASGAASLAADEILFAEIAKVGVVYGGMNSAEGVHVFRYIFGEGFKAFGGAVGGLVEVASVMIEVEIGALGLFAEAIAGAN